MSITALPDILFKKEYKSTWEWDGWKPKAKANAPKKVKDAIDKWISEAVDGDDDESADIDSEFDSLE